MYMNNENFSFLMTEFIFFQALAAHKFREQQEFERKRALEDARNREIAKQNQIKERREKIIEAERERRDELLKRNMVSENFFGFDIKVEELHQSSSSFYCPQLWVMELAIFWKGKKLNSIFIYGLLFLLLCICYFFATCVNMKVRVKK